MPLDPSISLSAKAPVSDPLAMLGTYAGIQNQLNQNQLFQQTFAARQKAGQILAASPDIDTGVANILKDPSVAPFATEFLNSMRQLELTTTELQGQQMKQSTDGYGAMMQTMVGAYGKPELLPKLISARMQGLSPSAKATFAAGMPSLQAALTDDLPKGDDAASKAARAAEFNRRFMAIVAPNVSAEALKNTVSSPILQDLGGRVVAGVQAPGWAGGGVTLSGPALGKTLAPTVVQGTGPEGQPIAMVAGGGMGGPMGHTAALQGRPGASATSGGLSATTSGGPSAALPRGALMVGPTATRSAEMETMGKAAGEVQADMQADAKRLPSMVKQLDMMNHALTEFQAGGFAEGRAGVAKWLQGLKDLGLPVSQKMVDDTAKGNIAASQLFEKEVKPLVISALKDSAEGTGRVMRSEVDAFLTMMDRTTDPKALMDMLNQARYTLQVGYDRTQKWPQYKQGVASGAIPGDMADFYGWHASQLDPAKLPEKTPGGLRLGPVGGAKGTTPSKRPPLSDFFK